MKVNSKVKSFKKNNIKKQIKKNNVNKKIVNANINVISTKKKKVNIKEKINKVIKSINKHKKIYYITFGIIFLITIIIFSTYNIINFNLYNKIITQKSDKQIIIDCNNNFLLLWDKTVNYIKNSNKDIVIKTPYFDVNLGKNNISKCVSINGFDIKSEKLKYSEISNLDGIIVNIPRIKDGVKEVTFLKNNKFKLNNLIDIYYIKDNNKIELLETGVDTTNGVTFKLTKDEKNNVYTKYIFVYVPIKDFNFNFESIELNKNCTKQLEVTFIPENCTDKDIVYNLEDKEICEISKENVLKAKKVGEYKINTKIKNINKSFNLKINEVAENIKVNKKSISLFIGQTTTIIASVLPKNAINNELEYISSDDKIVTINEIGKVVSKKVGKCEIEIKTKIEPIVSVKIPITINEKTAVSSNNVSGLTYIKGILVVNKKYGIPSSYNPGANKVALDSYNKLKNDAKVSGFNINILSGFRSYNTQSQIYSNYVKQYGQAVTDTFSAKPGYSEHQTGLAFDVGSISNSYGDTPSGKWLANNCYKYGYIIRYPKNKQGITGYKYEPWHIRYVGVVTATKIFNSGLCLEEFLGI